MVRLLKTGGNSHCKPESHQWFEEAASTASRQSGTLFFNPEPWQQRLRCWRGTQLCRDVLKPEQELSPRCVMLVSARLALGFLSTVHDPLVVHGENVMAASSLVLANPICLVLPNFFRLWI
jgi:hypothetical protein